MWSFSEVTEEIMWVQVITLSGRLLASAIFVIGKAEVFEAKTQCSGMY